jgi:nucleoside-diphosphate-sugar epimerase
MSSRARRSPARRRTKDSVPSTGPVVVTGGSGFVGRRLVEMLVEQGRDVVSFDRVVGGEAMRGVRHVTGDLTELYIEERGVPQKAKE